MPETFLARFPVSVKSFFSRRTREKPLVPRVFKWPVDLVQDVFTWRHTPLVGVSDQLNGGHVGVPNQSCGSWSLFPRKTRSDQQQFSPNYIITSSREKIMRINTCDHQRQNALIFYQILSTNSLRKCVDISLENLYMDIGDLRVMGKTADESCLYKQPR